jgi:hypothetical protein
MYADAEELYKKGTSTLPAIAERVHGKMNEEYCYRLLLKHFQNR